MLAPWNTNNSRGSCAITSPTPVTVVPNTTYVITVVSSTFAANNASSFGSVYYWSGANQLQIFWME
jgi:hypothetical protein